MRFLSIYTARQAPSGPPSQEEMDRMGAMMERMTKEGILIFAGGMGQHADGFKVSLDKSKFASANGPLTDMFAKSMGFAIMEAPSRAALEPSLKEFLEVAGDGECEVMPIFMGP